MLCSYKGSYDTCILITKRDKVNSFESEGRKQRLFASLEHAIVYTGKRKCREKHLDKEMAGNVGFEPTHGGVKVRCLTAWRIPKIKRRLADYSEK